MAKKQAIKKICAIYDSQVLAPLLGRGEVRQRLREGLERVLTRNIHLESSSQEQDTADAYLNDPIDLKDIFQKTSNRRLVSALARASSLKTYADILAAHKDSAYPDCRSGLLKLKGIGIRCYLDLKEYLDVKGIKLD